jgi:thioredoxin
MSKMDFDSLIVNDKIVLVDFYADWCEPCKRMKPFLDEIALEMVDKVEVIRINADEHPNLCKTLGINALPVVQVYKNKQLSWTHNGYISKKELMGYLN